MPPRGSGRFSNRRPVVVPPAIERPEKIERPAEPEPSAPAEAPGLSEPKADRVSIALKADGTPDWDAMRPSTQERIRKAFPQAGGPASTALVEAIAPTLVKALLASVSTLGVGLARAWGYAPADAMRLTDEEIAGLVPPWTDALNDYALTLGRHEKLIVACVATGVVYLPRVQTLHKAGAPVTLKPVG